MDSGAAHSRSVPGDRPRRQWARNAKRSDTAPIGCTVVAQTKLEARPATKKHQPNLLKVNGFEGENRTAAPRTTKTRHVPKYSPIHYRYVTLAYSFFYIIYNIL